MIQETGMDKEKYELDTELLRDPREAGPLREMLKTDIFAEPPRDPREVVLRYEQEVRPVEERYVQPTPLPGRRNVFRAPVKAKSRRRGVKIFLACLAVVLLAAAALAALYFTGALSPRGDAERGEYEWSMIPTQTRVRTTMPTYPNGDGTKLHYRESHGEALSAQEIYARVNPSTVTVIATMEDGSASVGTGVIMTENGYVLTNAHVIVGAESGYIVCSTGAYYEAELVGLDEEKDLAVIKVEASGLPAAEFGDSDALTVGDTVYAIGNPLGVELRGTLTDGIVSAINRDVFVDGVTMTLIQTNAALNNGNSGGPLINACGQVVGINTMKMGSTTTDSVEGLGFAIPIASSAYMVNDLIAFGEIRGEAVIGIMVNTEAIILPDGTSALLIREVTENGPGDKAGIRRGDYVTAADGEALTSSNDLIRIRRRHDAGETLRLELMRDGEAYSAEVILEISGK